MRGLYTIVLVALLVAGCATTPCTVPVPVDRLLAFQKSTPKSDSTLVVTRQEGIFGSGCYMALYINGTLAARIAPQETSTFHVPSGEVELIYGGDPLARGMCQVVGKNYNTGHEMVIHKGETKYFRVTVDANGKLLIERFSP